MPRALAVGPGAACRRRRQAEYLAAAGELAAALRVRGQHLWVFRHPTEPGRLPGVPRVGRDGEPIAPWRPTDAEARLIRALRALGSYAPGADDLWLEVSLTEGRTFVDGSE